MLQAGDTLAGYRIEAVAGVGGMGVVYRATQISLDRPVALKVLSSTLVGNRTFRERFRREGRHAAALDHPNIIPVYEAGESNGLMFIAMRLVDGPSLADIIERGELPGNAAIGILRSVASALDAAHHAGLVHRDIKPQNMLLTKGGHPYLADFGITKGSDHGGLTHNGDFVGSLNYVAPEQIEGRDVGGASDIYSLAAVLFQALTGAYPYQRDTDAALMHAHLTAEPPSLRDRGIDAPAALDAVFAKGMAKSPAERFSSGTELLDACLAAVVDVRPDQLARTPSFPLPGGETGTGQPADEPAASTHPDRFVWTPPAVPPPTPVSTAVPPRREPAGPAAQASAENRTTADARRPSLADASAGDRAADGERSSDRKFARALPRAGLALLLVSAPILGYLLGRSPEVPAPQAARGGSVALTHASVWKPGSGAIDGLPLDDPVTLRRADGTKLVAGRLAEFAPGFDVLPQAVRRRLAAPAKPVVAKLGDGRMVRYAGALKSGDHLWVVLAPDSKGWTAVACEGASSEATRACGAVAASVRVAGARPVAPGPDAAIADEISVVLTRLGAARAQAGAGLAAKRLPKRESAARQLASAHDDAADELRELQPRPQEASLLSALARAIDAEGQALARVGAAAGRRDAAAYRRARGEVRRAQSAVESALGRLERAGYGAA